MLTLIQKIVDVETTLRDMKDDYGTVVYEWAISGQLFQQYVIPRSGALVSTVETIKNTLDAEFSVLFEGVENMP